MGTGSGLLAMMAAQAGADRCAAKRMFRPGVMFTRSAACSVVAVDIHEPLALVARRNIAANGLSQRISVACRDVGLIERGNEVRQQGCNFVVMDMLDAGLLGDRVGTLLGMVGRNVLQPGATVVPAAATVYCVGIEALTSDVHGFDFSKFNQYRRVPCCVLAPPKFPADRHARALQLAERI
jgi:protein arginine N-methyltransferase 7